MECPKCHTVIDDNSTTCPACHKVLLLECPNCHELGDSSVCSNCGYTILVKCAKCERVNPVLNDMCPGCGFPTATSLAYNECETDEFASAVIKFTNLNKIRQLLNSKDLYEKFLHKIRNLFFLYVKKTDTKVIEYADNVFAVNFNKELSFATSSEKAARFALKLANAFTEINLGVLNEFKIPLGLNICITQKLAENLQKLTRTQTDIKFLNAKLNKKKYIKGFQIVLDQYVRDEINKIYRTDSLYCRENNGQNIMFYEIILDSYISPPDENKVIEEISGGEFPVSNELPAQEERYSESFNLFDIKAKCAFEKTNAVSVKNIFATADLKVLKIISLRSDYKYGADLNELAQICKNKGFDVISVSCTEAHNYRPWSVFIDIFRSYFSLSVIDKYNDYLAINEKYYTAFKPLFELARGNALKTASPEDARYAYMEMWSKFFAIMKKTVIIINGFENLDDTAIQTLDLYFDKFKKIVPNFIFITNENTPVHSKLKGLLRTKAYTEYNLLPVSFDTCVSEIRSDAGDFIDSFYFDKIRENFCGSYLYFKNALEYLKETDSIVEVDGKLFVKDSESIILPNDFHKLFKERMKYFDQKEKAGLIFAYAYVFGGRIGINTLETLGIKDPDKITKTLTEYNFAVIKNGFLILNNYMILENTISEFLKQKAETIVAGNIINVFNEDLDYSYRALLNGKKGDFKQEYNLLLKNSDFAMSTGDYDAYLKNCLGFLSLMETVKTEIPQEELEAARLEVYNNILICLYDYEPKKIYFIENILLQNAIKNGDGEKVKKLSNLMLQGALLSSNYNDAQGLLDNIIAGLDEPELVVNGAVNTRFLLLSLVQIEIFYYTGEYQNCVNKALELLSVIRPSMIGKIKPPGFSAELFTSHLADIFRIAALSKVYLADDDLEEFFNKVEISLGVIHPEKDAITAIRDYLAGRIYSIGDIEKYSAFSKIIFLLLQEVSSLQNNNKRFAQDIFQAKLLSEDISQYELKYICDLFIGYAYMKAENYAKAESIFKDVIKTAQNSGMFLIKNLAKYFLADSNIQTGAVEDGLLILNEILANLREKNNDMTILYALAEKYYIEILKAQDFSSVNFQAEEEKLAPYKTKLVRILS